MSYGGDFFRKFKDTLEEISQKTDMHIIVEHVSAIALDEGEAEIAAVVDAIRKLGSTGEGKQWAAAQGLDIYNMSDKDIRNKIFFRIKQKKLYFDLSNYVKSMLLKNKIKKIEKIKIDTFDFKNKFFSARRALSLKHADYGRNISIIMLN